MSCGQALKHPYFKEMRDQDKSLAENSVQAMRSIKINENYSLESKSKFSDNNSENSFNTGVASKKIDLKTQTFNLDAD